MGAARQTSFAPPYSTVLLHLLSPLLPKRGERPNKGKDNLIGCKQVEGKKKGDLERNSVSPCRPYKLFASSGAQVRPSLMAVFLLRGGVGL